MRMWREKIISWANFLTSLPCLYLTLIGFRERESGWVVCGPKSNRNAKVSINPSDLKTRRMTKSSFVLASSKLCIFHFLEPAIRRMMN
jgi:hypothetical protein